MFSKLKKQFIIHNQYFKNALIFMDTNPKYCLSKRDFDAILKCYEEWIEFEGGFIGETEVLRRILITAFRSNIDDSHYIQKILIHLYNRWAMHFVMFFGHESFHKLLNPDKRLNFAEFILRHANRRRLLICEMRITDLLISRHPCYYPVILGLPKLLLIFLRYGALTSGKNNNSKFDIVEIIKHIIYYICPETSNTYEIQITMSDSRIACGKVLLRVCPQLEKDLVFRKDSRILQNTEKTVTLWKGVINNILPELETRIFQPMLLRQMCRLKIREVLHEKWLLPDGIERLPLPQMLKDYLDLFYD